MVCVAGFDRRGDSWWTHISTHEWPQRPYNRWLSAEHSVATQEHLMKIQFTLNGKTQPVECEPQMPLLWVLRDTLGLTGTKYGCGEAICGACTVLQEGRPVRS